MSENPPPGFDEIHGSLTAPLLPSLEGSEVLAAPAQPDVPLNPTLPTLSWDPTTASVAASSPTDTSAVDPTSPAPAVLAPAPIVAETPANPASAAPPEGLPVAVAPVAAPGTSTPVVAPVAAASMAPALPTVTPPTPTPPPATGFPPALAGQFESPQAQSLESHRVRDAVGSIVRTLAIAALVAAAVFAGRYGWQWNEDRHSDAVAAEVLPATPVAAVDARFVAFRSVDGNPTTAHVDLATGDFVANVSATTELARRGDEYWMRDAADGLWVPASPELLNSAAEALETIEGASLVMISDVLPVDAYPYVTVTADEMVVLSGRTLRGPEVIEVTESESSDDEPSDDRIATAGNSDPLLDDVVDNIANPAVDDQATAPIPTGGRVFVRHLTVTIDRLALRTGDPYLAESSRLDGATPLVIDIWVDRTGVVRQLSTAAGAGGLPAEYELISATSDGLGPLADLGLPTPVPVAPTEEVAQ